MKRFILRFVVVIVGVLLPFIVAAEENLRVVGLEKPSYTRVIFYIDQPVEFDTSIEGKNVRVNLRKELKADFRGVIDVLGSRVATVSQENDKTIKIGLKDGNYKLRKFLGKGFFGFDLVDKNYLKSKKSTPKQEKPKVSNLTNKKPSIIPKKFAVNPPQPELKRKFEPTSLVEDIRTDSTSSELLEAFAIARAVEEEIVEEAVEGETTEEVKNDQDAEKSEISDNAAEAKKIEDLIKRDIALPITSVEGKITFPWDQQVGAAIFVRGDFLWAVFDESRSIDTNMIVDINSDYFVEGEQINNKHFTVLRFRLKDERTYFSAYKDEDSWIVEITEEELELEDSIDISVAMSELHGSTVMIPSDKEATPIRLIDPEIGDEIIVIPSTQEGSASDTTWKYTDFIVIKTLQGVAVQLMSDDIEIKISDNNVGLVGPANRLAGSAQSALRELQEREREAKLRAERLKQKASELTLLKYKTWSLGGQREYRRNLNDLEWKITEADWGSKSEHRLNLARFYFVHGMSVDALGVTQMIKEFDKEFGEKNEVKMIEGAAQFSLGRYQLATDVFDSMDMSKYKEDRDVEEARFWRAASHLHLDRQMKMDKYLSKNPVEEKKKEKTDVLDSGDKVEITKLMLETSSRLLKMIRKMDPDFVNAEEVQTLESTARFVVDHYQDAIRRFEETDLFRSGDVFEVEEDKLWWSTASSRRSSKATFAFLDNKNRFLKYYPTKLYNDFALLALEERIQKNDLGAAEEIMQSFRDDDKRKRFKNSLEFLKGLFYAKDEEPEKAVASWEPLVKEVHDRYNRTRATFALTVYNLQREEIGLDEAIANFNSIRSSWRGGVLELNTLKLLGEFYMDKKEYMEGFKVWREVVSTFPGSEEALLIAKRMSEKFVQIFNQGDIDEIDQLEALTLYYEFRELTPIGKLGDEMIGRLADRLIKIDLLDRAAALLTHQVRFRLGGEEKDKASVKLVKVHLANQDPQSALDVLNATGIESIIPELEMEKKYLKARTLIELGKNNQTLALLRGDDNHKASFLRADVYWRKKVWKKVIEELETPFRELRREERALGEDETDQLLRLAVAYAIVERKKRLQILYEDFIDFVEDKEREKVLTFVASDRGTVDFRDLEGTVGYDDMHNFLDKYLKSGGEESTDTAIAEDIGGSEEES